MLARLRRVLRVIALVASTVLVIFVAAELAMTFGSDVLLRGSLYTYDPEMGFRVRPYARWGDEHTNEFGFNDRDHAHAKPPGVVRVLVLGDSFNWAGRRDTNYVGVLRRALAGAPGDTVEVINAGYPGTHPGEELVALRRFGLQYDPDVVVLGLFVGNDFLEADPWRRVVPIGGVLTPIDTRHDVILTLWGRPLVWRSHLLRWSQAQLDAYRRARQRPFAPPSSAGLGIPDELYWALERERMAVVQREAAAGLAVNERYVFDALAAMQRLVAERGGRFVVAAYPDEFQVDDELRRQVIDRYHLDADAYEWARPQARLAEFCAAHGIEFRDLLPSFRAAHLQGTRLYLHNDSHWNDAGNALAAAYLVDVVRAAITRPSGFAR